MTATLQPNRRRLALMVGLLVLIFQCACAVFDSFANDAACRPIDRLLHLTSCTHAWQNSDYVRAIEFSADSHTLLVTTYQDVTLWDVASGTKLQTLPYVAGLNPRWSAFSPDGTQIATAGSTGVQVVDRLANTIRYMIPYQGGMVDGGFAFSPDGQLLAVSEFRHDQASTYDLVRVLDAQDGRQRATIPSIRNLHLSTLRFTPDSQHVVVWVGSRPPATESLQVWLWDLQQHRLTSRLPGYAVISPDATIGLVDADDPQGIDLLILTADNSRYVHQQTLTTPCAARENLAFFDDGRRVLTITNAYEEEFTRPAYPTLCVVRLADGQVVWQSNVQQGQCVAVAPNKRIAALCVSGTIQIWDVPSAWYQ